MIDINVAVTLDLKSTPSLFLSYIRIPVSLTVTRSQESPQFAFKPRLFYGKL